MRWAALAAAVVTLAVCRIALARVPPFRPDPREGVWIAAGEVLVQQSNDRWRTYAGGAGINDLVVDDRLVWLATDDGVVRFDPRSKSPTRLGMESGLPSLRVTSIAADEQYLWFGTNKGLVRYRKLDRTLKVYTEQDGLPDKAINYILVIGRDVWFATRAGLALYNPSVDGIRGFTEKDGLPSGYIEELFLVGEDVWCRTDVGLSRFRIKARVFTSFSLKELGGNEIRTFTLDGSSIWIGTENGLVEIDTASDHVRPFTQQSALQGKDIRGVEASSDYLYITTDKETVQYNKNTRSIRRFTEADGIVRNKGARGSLLSGDSYILLFDDGAEVYSVQQDLWVQRDLLVTQQKEEENKTEVSVFGQFNGSAPYDLTNGQFGGGGYATAQGGVGFGRRFDNGRQLTGSIWLDYGQVTEPGIRDLEYKLEYLGANRDVLREILIEDKLPYRYQEEGLERPLLLQGARVRLTTPERKPHGEITAHGGLRRGVVARDFITGPRREIYQLSNKYIVPGTERVYVDGERLTNGTDYTIVYPAGQLAFLDPERIDDLSVISVEYEYDLMPKKELGSTSILELLPADREVGDWTRNGQVRLITDETGLYNQIDGAAPKYIDRNWARSVYAEYRQGSRTIQVAIHDMQTDADAQAIFDYDRPAAAERVDPARDNMLLDLGLSTAYATKSHTGRFYIELSIDEKSEAAKESIRLFTLEIIDRKEKAGAGAGDPFKEWLVAERVSGKPTDEIEVGARAVRVQERDDGSEIGRRLTQGAVDARFERKTPGGGLFTAYSELAGSSRGDVERDGAAGMSMMRFSHPSFEGTFSGRVNSSDYTAIGSSATRFGRMRDEATGDATAYAFPWLSTTVFLTRQTSYLEDRPGYSELSHVLGRVQVHHERYPSASIQVGNAELQSQGHYDTNRLQIVGQSEYDLARVLTFLKRFNVNALYSVSEATTRLATTSSFVDRARLTRVEAKLSPTSTESLYGLFRSRTLDRRPTPLDPFERAVLHWEALSGAQSAIIPGLLPQVTYTVSYDDSRLDPNAGTTPPTVPPTTNPPEDTVPISATTPPGPGDVTLGTSLRAAKTTVSTALGIYPGQWWAPAAPVVVEPRAAVTNDEKAEGDLKTSLEREYRFDNRAVYTSAGPIEVELYQLYLFGTTGQEQSVNRTRQELRNRFVYRPVVTSPITLRLNYQNTRQLNAVDAIAAGSGDWATQDNYEAIIDWLKRWNKHVTTKPRTSFSVGTTSDFPSQDAQKQIVILSYTQYRVGVEFEVRFFPLNDVSALYLFQRNAAYQLYGNGIGALHAIQYLFSVGGIWRMDDKMTLDTEWIYRQTYCLSQEWCSPSKVLEPRLFWTTNL